MTPRTFLSSITTPAFLDIMQKHTWKHENTETQTHTHSKTKKMAFSDF